MGKPLTEAQCLNLQNPQRIADVDGRPVYEIDDALKVTGTLDDGHVEEWRVALLPITDVGTDRNAALNFTNHRYDASRLGWTPEELVSLCARRGFIFPSGELYGGINGFWDYGPLGVELKNNRKALRWQRVVRERDDVEGIDSAIVTHPRTWEASGHVQHFSDPMVDCKACKKRFRADQLDDVPPCPSREGTSQHDFTAPRDFNLMLKTFVGASEDAAAVAYLRAETCGSIFTDWKRVRETSRQKIPFGIAQIGKDRVLFIARWPGRIPAGGVSSQLMGHVDTLATFAALTGQKLAADAGPDSFNVLTALLGEKTAAPARDHLVLQNNGQTPLALRQGDWMLIQKAGDLRQQPQPSAGTAPTPELYNLATDLAQTNNLAPQQPAARQGQVNAHRTVS